MTSTIVARNPLRTPLTAEPIDSAVRAFHTRMPGYAPTPLFDVPDLADRFGVGRVLVKAETQRMGLPSFKILGASWATYRAVVDHIGKEPAWTDVAELAAAVAPMRPFRLAAATDGNHGRAVAHMARLFGFDCDIFVPAGMSAARIDAIESEGATVTIVDGTYDEAVRRAAQQGSDTCLVIADTSSDDTDQTPARVVDGYSTIFEEIDEDLRTNEIEQPDVVVVPVGVGSLLAATVAHYRSAGGDTMIVGVEPHDANSVQMSALAGTITPAPGPHRSIMVGLNCDTPSHMAWPTISRGTDWFVSIPDSSAEAAMRDLADAGIVAGETGAAALGGFAALVADGAWSADRDPADVTVLLLVTEGATDPANYRRIVGRSHNEVEPGQPLTGRTGEPST